MSEFVLGGAIPLESPVYQHREFEDACVGHLAASRWVLLLGPRQHGKTSALVRLQARLVDEGFRVALVDMQTYAGPATAEDYATFIRWFVVRVASGLSLPIPAAGEVEALDLEASLAAALASSEGDLVVLIDEASAVPTPVRTRFFAQLRALFNARAFNGPGAWMRRMNILFAGTFRPESVIEDDNSPFNVSTVVYTADLSEDDAISMVSAATGSGEFADLAKRAHALVGGQPYLLQRILEVVTGAAPGEESLHLFESIASDLRNGRDRHIPALFERVIAETGGVEALKMLADSPDGIPENATPPFDILPVLGVAKLAGGRLLVANELYRQAALASPQINPTAPAINFVALAHQTGAAFDVMKDPTLRQVTWDAYSAGVDSANAGHFRFALAGFGAAYEALVADFVENVLTAVERTTATVGVQQSGKALSNNVDDWTFQSMTEVAHNSKKLPTVKAALSDTVRQWRNLIHPKNAAKNFQPDKDFGPEVNVAVAAVEKLLQALRGLAP